MKHTTRWQPDTCECIVDYEWDDAEEPRVHRITNVIRQCPLHEKLGKIEDIFSGVVDDNRLKNIVVNKVAELISTKVEDIPFSFDEKRQLHLALDSKTSHLEKSSIQSVIDTLVGETKVKVE